MSKYFSGYDAFYVFYPQWILKDEKPKFAT